MAHSIVGRTPGESSSLPHAPYCRGYDAPGAAPGSWSVPPLPPLRRSSGLMPQASHPYVLSLRRASSRQMDGAASDVDQTPSCHGTEHILRRKTPNGTLAAGYDGTPVEWTSRPHAMKRILLPLPNKPNISLHQHSSPSSGLSEPAPLRHPSLDSFSPLSYRGRTESDAQEIGPTNDTSAKRSSRAWMGPGPQYPRSMDSMLNQGAIFQTSPYYTVDSAQLPSMLQPSYQSCLGPTASNSEGPYGPYWPNGAFIPYRPAALRDTRYHAVHESPGWIDGGNAAFNGGNAHLWPQTINVPCSDNAMTDLGLHASGTLDYPSYGPPRYDAHPDTALGIAPSNRSGIRTGDFHPVDGSFGTPTVPGSSFSLRRTPHRSNSTHLAPNPVPPSTPFVGSNPIPVGHQLLTAGTAWAPGASHFKDKLLSWAHSVYVDLLTSLHHGRPTAPRNHPDASASAGRLLKSGIYPRPPRQPSMIFSASPADPASTRHDHLPETQATPSGTSSQRLGCHARNGSIQVNSRTDVSLDCQGQSNHSHTLHNPAHHPDRQQPVGSLNHTTPDCAKSQALGPSAATATASAATALELIARLCAESAWAWIDGMLLAGCLAYGLGNYSEALTWYSRILGIDASHVEATSNLAATLLSLGRREEAEQYWLRSVKLRPSYFEAVEHLIGLLCEDHRGKEAVTIIEFVERSLRYVRPGESFKAAEHWSETGSEASFCSSIATSETSERMAFNSEREDGGLRFRGSTDLFVQPGFGSSGYAIPATENGRILALVHAKGNMLYALGDNNGAARAFEDVVLIAAEKRSQGIQGLIERILSAMAPESTSETQIFPAGAPPSGPVLLLPDKALQTARLVFPRGGELPGLAHIPPGMAKKAAISTTSNSLLSLAKIFQDGMSTGALYGPKTTSGIRDILALYYLSLALQPSPSTANNVGILLASVQHSASARSVTRSGDHQLAAIPGVVPGSGVSMALAYYNYGLNLDSRHAHLFTNLGSLLKDIGQLTAAIKMYEQAVSCDGKFDIALANLANAVKDQGRISDAIRYYRRAVAASPDFAEAVCGLANALNSVCAWTGRGGEATRERWHVDENGMLADARSCGPSSSGWMKRVIDIVERQLAEGHGWGQGVLHNHGLQPLLNQLELADTGDRWPMERRQSMEMTLKGWMGKAWEGSRIVRLIERAIKRLGWQWYQDKHLSGKDLPPSRYTRPQLPPTLSVPAAPTVLPFHTFTCPLSAQQIRMISQRNGLRISCSTLRSHWLPDTVYSPPGPPNPHLNVGYVSSDFNNHPLAHLMQSVFGLHDPARVKAFCYATTAGDHSVHRQQIEREAPVFHDASGWSAERLVGQIVRDGIHILVNLNGYTRGARNEIFAARPAPIQMSFMGFAGTLGAEWCDYLLADETAVPLETLRPWRRNVDLEDQTSVAHHDLGPEEWVYSENIIFSRDTFFCCDHRQSAPDAQEERLGWDEEQSRRWAMRKELFPSLSDDAVILGNFNQLYKIDPSTFRSWLRILARVPNAILWLLRFPDLGESNLKRTAERWAGQEVASRVMFTDVAPKHQHISRARLCDLFLDTPECNAHTTAADVLWSGTPILTLPRYKYKMCSRMAASIVKGALPKTAEGERAADELIAGTEEEYEDRAVRLGNGLAYRTGPSQEGRGDGRLMELRRMLYEGRWTSALFDTRRWVRDLERAYETAWQRWVVGEGGDIWL